MQTFYSENFDREMDCTENEWLVRLPHAIGPHPFQQVAKAVMVRIDAGQLRLSWRVGAPRPMVPTPIARLLVSFRFNGVDDLPRYRFMKHFDLYTQQGGA